MKKIIIGIMVILVAGGAVAFFYLQSNNQKPVAELKKIEENLSESEPESTTDKKIAEELEKFKNEGSGEGSRCVFSIRSGDRNFEAEAYISEDKYKTVTFSGDSDNEKKFTVFDGENFYTWREGEAKGFQMNLKCAEEIGMEVEEGQEAGETDPAEMKLEPVEVFDNAQSADCSPIEEANLTIPDDVEFVDQCQMLKNQMEEIKKLQ